MRKCPTCNSDNRDNLNDFKKEKQITSKLENIYDLSICKDCGLVYYSTIPSDETMINLYTNDYRQTDEFNKKTRIEDWSKKILLWSTILSPAIDNIHTVLDIGCAEGHWLKHLQNNGKDVLGLELNELSVEYGKKMGIDIRPIDILDFDIDKKFDLIFMSGLLEHTKYPKKVISKCRELLSDNGYLYIQIPDLYCPNTHDIKDFFPTEHFQAYSRNDIVNLLSLCNMKEVKYIKNLYNHGHVVIAMKNDSDYVINNNYDNNRSKLQNLKVEHDKVLMKQEPNAESDFLDCFRKVKIGGCSDRIFVTVMQNIKYVDIDKLYTLYISLKNLFEQEDKHASQS